MQRIAAERGGECLSEEYLNGATRLTWRCSQGHIWEATPHNVIHHRSWCRHCEFAARRGRKLHSHVWSADKRRARLDLLQSIARSRGGECLEQEYVTAARKYRFLCARGHVFLGQANSVRRGHWCAECAGNVARITLPALQAAAAARGGACLAAEYLGSRRKLPFQCDRGHIWEATPSRVMRGNWCPQCCFDKQRGTLEEMRAIAVARGGRCLSSVYVTARTRMLWECHRGHRWMASPDNVKNKRSWCPECSLMAFVEGVERKRRRRRGQI